MYGHELSTQPSETSYYVYSSGKAYKVAQDGDVLIARERGITLGEVRMFFYHSSRHDQCMYFAEREFRSFFHPVRAPKIWWRKITE